MIITDLDIVSLIFDLALGCLGLAWFYYFKARAKLAESQELMRKAVDQSVRAQSFLADGVKEREECEKASKELREAACLLSLGAFHEAYDFLRECGFTVKPPSCDNRQNV